MDKVFQTKLLALIERILTKVFGDKMRLYEERWLTAEQICEHVGVMTPRWLKDHGEMFPRTRIEWTDKKGPHATSWMYPLHQIQEMIADGRIKQLAA